MEASLETAVWRTIRMTDRKAAGRQTRVRVGRQREEKKGVPIPTLKEPMGDCCGDDFCDRLELRFALRARTMPLVRAATPGTIEPLRLLLPPPLPSPPLPALPRVLAPRVCGGPAARIDGSFSVSTAFWFTWCTSLPTRLLLARLLARLLASLPTTDWRTGAAAAPKAAPSCPKRSVMLPMRPLPLPASLLGPLNSPDRPTDGSPAPSPGNSLSPRPPPPWPGPLSSELALLPPPPLPPPPPPPPASATSPLRICLLVVAPLLMEPLLKRLDTCRPWCWLLAEGRCRCVDAGTCAEAEAEAGALRSTLKSGTNQSRSALSAWGRRGIGGEGGGGGVKQGFRCERNVS